MEKYYPPSQKGPGPASHWDTQESVTMGFVLVWFCLFAFLTSQSFHPEPFMSSRSSRVIQVFKFKTFSPRNWNSMEILFLFLKLTPCEIKNTKPINAFTFINCLNLHCLALKSLKFLFRTCKVSGKSI